MQFSDDLILDVKNRAPQGVTFERDEVIEALRWAVDRPLALPTWTPSGVKRAALAAIHERVKARSLTPDGMA